MYLTHLCFLLMWLSSWKLGQILLQWSYGNLHVTSTMSLASCLLKTSKCARDHSLGTAVLGQKVSCYHSVREYLVVGELQNETMALLIRNSLNICY